jgi:hypothetical protein
MRVWILPASVRMFKKSATALDRGETQSHRGRCTEQGIGDLPNDSATWLLFLPSLEISVSTITVLH